MPDTRQQQLTEVQITPIKPQDGLVAFASLVLNGNLYLGSIGLFTRPQGGYRLAYPIKKVSFRDINMFHPINKDFASEIEAAVVAKYEEVMNSNDDRYNSLNTQ